MERNASDPSDGDATTSLWAATTNGLPLYLADLINISDRIPDGQIWGFHHLVSFHAGFQPDAILYFDPEVEAKE